MQSLKVLVFQFLLLCVRLEARVLGVFLKRNPRGSRRVAVLEPCPSSVDSNGDEALLAGTCRFLNEQPATSVALLSFYDRYGGRLPANTTFGGSLYHHGDGDFRKALRYFKWPLLLARYDELYVIGADLIDGYYDSSVSRFLFFLLHIAAHLRVKGNLISFSFNASPPESVARAARALLRETRVHARDAYSAERLAAVLGRPVSHSADVAFGLVPETTDQGQEIVAWIRAQEAASRRVLALNVNLLPINKQQPGRQADYLRQWGQWLLALSGQGFSFVLLPHDYRDEWSDEAALISLFEQASPETRAYCFLPRVRLHAPEIKHVLAHCLLSVTGRMHLAIASLGMGVPVVAYAYQSKFQGILRLFGIEDCVRPIEGIFDRVADEIAFTVATTNQVGPLRTRVRAHGDEVLTLARQNIAPPDGSHA